MANEFNNFFVNIRKNTIQNISTLAEQFRCEEHDFTFVPREYPVSEQFFFDDNVNVDEVQKIIKSMAPNKSPGIDKIPLRVIKDCLPGILPSVTSIINATFRSAQFPNVWKIAEVTPILKDGDQEIPNNYMPISLLPVLSKICERFAISDQLPMTCGMPQGSILGPLLFSIYTNELPSIPHHSSSQCYVDDTKFQSTRPGKCDC